MREWLQKCIGGDQPEIAWHIAGADCRFRQRLTPLSGLYLVIPSRSNNAALQRNDTHSRPRRRRARSHVHTRAAGPWRRTPRHPCSTAPRRPAKPARGRHVLHEGACIATIAIHPMVLRRSAVDSFSNRKPTVAFISTPAPPRPRHRQERPAPWPTERAQRERRIGTGNQQVDRAVIQHPEHPFRTPYRNE